MTSVLKRLLQIDDPLRSGLDKNISLCLNVLDLVLLVHLVLLHLFHCDDLATLPVPTNPDFTEGTPPYYRQRFEVFYGHFFSPTFELEHSGELRKLTLCDSTQPPCAGCLT